MTKKKYFSRISIFVLIVIMMSLASATDELRISSAAKFYPDYPVGTPPIQGGTGYVTEAKDCDGWHTAIGFGQQYTKKDNPGLYGLYHAGEDWNTDAGGSSDVGKSVYAIAGGFVTAIKDEIYPGLNYGSGIVIEHTLPNDKKIYSVYEHIDITSGLSDGDFIGQGDRIGTIAAISPLSPHLHFEIRTKWVEPGERWYTHDVGGTAYYASKDDIFSDGLIDPSDFIDSRRWYENGSTLYDQSKYEEALECFNNATTIEPQYAEAWKKKGDTFFIQGNLDQAIQCYEEATRIDSQYAEAWYGEGHTLYEKGNYDEAYRYVNEAITLNPEIPVFWKSMGDILTALDRSDEAQAAYDQYNELKITRTPIRTGAMGGVEYEEEN